MATRHQLDILGDSRPRLLDDVRSMWANGASVADITATLNRRRIAIDRRAVKRWIETDLEKRNGAE